MKYSSQASAERWEKAGIGEDSEFAWADYFKTAHHPPSMQKEVILRAVARGNKYSQCEIIGPAMVSDEMHKYSCRNELHVRWLDGDSYKIVSDIIGDKDYIEAETLTDAYEQAINWSLDQKEK